MMPIADLTFDQKLTPPLNRFCDIGCHSAPETWVPDPITGKVEEVRFYLIKTNDQKLNGKYVCELCSVIANYYAKEMKVKNG